MENHRYHPFILKPSRGSKTMVCSNLRRQSIKNTCFAQSSSEDQQLRFRKKVSPHHKRGLKQINCCFAPAGPRGPKKGVSWIRRNSSCCIAPPAGSQNNGSLQINPFPIKCLQGVLNFKAPCYKSPVALVIRRTDVNTHRGKMPLAC